MTEWERKICDAFTSRYDKDQKTLRLRSSAFFPDFDAAHPDEKESYLEAAESLERKGLLKLRWEKRGKGQRLETLTCNNIEKLFFEVGSNNPNTEAAEIRKIFADKAQVFSENMGADPSPTTRIHLHLLEHLSSQFLPRYVWRGINKQVMEDFSRFLEFSIEPSRMKKITTRALSIVLYNDSKRLENILRICKPLISNIKRYIPFTNLVFPERSYPETMISGNLVFEYKAHYAPLINGKGHILGLPFESAEEIKSIQPVSQKEEKIVLTIENKETFYALGSPQKYYTSAHLSRYDCFLYTGGYPNRAAAALIKILAASGFSFYHAGDLDPDGILILQNIQDIAEKPVLPLRMDAATFEQYRTFARSLTKPMIRHIAKIREETKIIPGIAELVQRIEETGLGVEQEIIDYR